MTFKFYCHFVAHRHVPVCMMHVFTMTCVCMMRVCTMTCVWWWEDDFVELLLCLPSCGCWGLNPGHQAWMSSTFTYWTILLAHHGANFKRSNRHKVSRYLGLGCSHCNLRVASGLSLTYMCSISIHVLRLWVKCPVSGVSTLSLRSHLLVVL